MEAKLAGLHGQALLSLHEHDPAAYATVVINYCSALLLCGVVASLCNSFVSVTVLTVSSRLA